MSSPTRKLLIVDDEPATRKLLSQIFTELGHNVRCAEDGFSALEMIREFTPDIILSDLNMPGMSGFELLSVIRRRLPAIYVIATSGAFSGESVPLGIVADAFYEKATGLRTLFGIMAAAALTESEIAKRSTIHAPIWIPKNSDPVSGDAYVTIGCPDCLRTFPQTLSAKLLVVHETDCVFCHNRIHYAIVQSIDPRLPLAYRQTSVPVVADSVGVPSVE
ncbi:response regulator [Granulicella sp. dw_53]|uniref:response regulator n=1 Tax=Granulicella sp. dw_53 TaxID=2719792 RepID=UPI001BD24848|nr:response regulator [Granulicella sp. dw_53]